MMVRGLLFTCLIATHATDAHASQSAQKENTFPRAVYDATGMSIVLDVASGSSQVSGSSQGKLPPIAATTASPHPRWRKQSQTSTRVPLTQVFHGARAAVR